MADLPCLLHVGQPKTGTTAIQDTLFWGLEDPRFRLISLDCDFGNVTMEAAFSAGPDTNYGVFFGNIPLRRRAAVTTSSLAYLDRALGAARRRGIVPIISAEMVWGFSRSQWDAARRFVVAHGFEPRIVCYLRPVLDVTDSLVAQYIKTGRDDLWEAVRRYLGRYEVAEHIRGLDQVFGRDNVELRLFDPAGFPGGCVVRDFCEAVGLDLDPAKIIRTNESLTQAATLFLHAFNQQGWPPPGMRRTVRRAYQAILKRVLRELPGPAFRLHAAHTGALCRLVEPQLPWLEDRLGRPFPLTLANRPPDGGIRGPADLECYTPESLDWLVRRTGGGPCRETAGPGARAEVARRLRRLVHRSSGAALEIARERLAIRMRRNRLRARMRS